MFLQMVKQLRIFSYSRWYWGFLLLIGVALMGAALIYQHVLGERPCLLCIQIRLWVSLLIFVAFAGLLVLNNRVMSSI
ncbi:MAG: disulfide bond formation protein B, partial [Gammaproteobacteria bacterium]|nr:disulfide bond formation protein B [Gammaproteobacteria bacterium]